MGMDWDWFEERGVDAGWIAVGAVAVLAVLGLLTWAGLQAAGEPAEPRIDAPEPDDETVDPDVVASVASFAPRVGGCATDGAGDAVQVRRTEPLRGGTRFVVNGSVQTPTPCYGLDASVEQGGGGYVLRITSSSSGGACVQCVGSIRYTASVIVPAEQLTVMHDGAVVDVVTR